MIRRLAAILIASTLILGAPSIVWASTGDLGELGEEIQSGLDEIQSELNNLDKQQCDQEKEVKKVVKKKIRHKRKLPRTGGLPFDPVMFLGAGATALSLSFIRRSKSGK
ncbi:MAG: hypothetical protein QME63_00930 [Actinomycetota bacterium]|nr:hypothetical protein [Actinomycetota bacterium]